MDKLYHFMVGLVLAIFFIKLGLNGVQILFIVLSIAISKEIVDHYTISIDYMEHLKDIAATIAPVIIGIVFSSRAKRRVVNES